jgi:two-component system NtrC family response regulator
MARKDLFRKDLLFRLRSFTIELPPLRGRTEDIPDLIAHYAAKLCERYGIEPKEFSPDFYDTLMTYPWPGNVRELIHALERALLNGRYERILFPKHLPIHIRAQIARSSVDEKGASEVRGVEAPRVLPRIQEARDRAIAEVEKKYLKDLIALTRGDIKEACRLSGLSRSRLYLLLKKYDISSSR